MTRFVQVDTEDYSRAINTRDITAVYMDLHDLKAYVVFTNEDTIKISTETYLDLFEELTCTSPSYKVLEAIVTKSKNKTLVERLQRKYHIDNGNQGT